MNKISYNIVQFAEVNSIPSVKFLYLIVGIILLFTVFALQRIIAG